MSLGSLSDKSLLSRIQQLTRRERAITLLVLLHLNEVERRRLHLKLGYSSMFDYCTSGLGYSASAASRRIRTARCVARYPEIRVLLQSNEVNISTVAQVSRILTVDNKDEILARIRGKSQREVEAVVARIRAAGAHAARSGAHGCGAGPSAGECIDGFGVCCGRVHCRSAYARGGVVSS